MKKVIGVMPLWDDKKESIWILPGYLNGIEGAGGLSIIFPMTADKSEIEQLCSLCDGFLFTGGHDVSPELFGEEPLNDSVVAFKKRDEMEMAVFEYAVRHDKPVLGICRGIQVINVALGGTLYQDLPLQFGEKVDHRMKPPYSAECHRVRIDSQSELFELLQSTEIGVNSCHHQAVKDLAPSLKVMAQSDDGLVEAVSMPGQKFMWAVQWHPEFSYLVDDNSKKIFEAFVDSCK